MCNLHTQQKSNKKDNVLALERLEMPFVLVIQLTGA